MSSIPKPEELLEQVEAALSSGEVNLPAEAAERMAKVNEILLRGTTDLTEVAQLMPSERAKLAQIGKLKEHTNALARMPGMGMPSPQQGLGLGAPDKDTERS